MDVPKNLEKVGFIKPSDKITNLILDICATPKQGKTHFSFTAPGPIAYFDFDYGTKGVINKFLQEGKDIYVKTIDIPDMGGEDLEKIAARSKVIWLDFIAAYEKAIGTSAIRTVILDTTTEAYELARLYKFGKLVEVMPHMYGHVKALFRRILKLSGTPGATQAGGKNLIMIHKMKDEYIGRNSTGKKVEAGFDDAPYIADIAGRMTKTNPTKKDKKMHFAFEVTACRIKTELEGRTFKDVMCNFPYLAAMTVDGTSPEDWE